MRTIQGYTKLLGPNHGIFADEKFIIAYNSFFFGATVSDVISLVLNGVDRDFDGCMEKDKDMHDIEYYREDLSLWIFMVCQTWCFFGANLLILVMIIRYSKKLDD